MRILSGLLLFSFLAGSVSFSQSFVVVPAGSGGAEGSGMVGVPGMYAPARAQFLYSKSVMPPPPFSIKEISIRRDGRVSTAFQAHSYQVELWASHLPRDPVSGYDAFWSRNRGKDWTKVLRKKTLYFPADQKPVQGPSPFSVRLVLDFPFTYKGGAFMMEWVFHSSSNERREWYADAVDDFSWKGEPAGAKVAYSGTSWPPGVRTYVPPPFLSSRFVHYGYVQTKGRQILVLGLVGNNTKKWGNLLLPFDLRKLGFPGGGYSTVPLLYTNAVIFVSTLSKRGKPPWEDWVWVELDGGFVPDDKAVAGMKYTFQMLGFYSGPGGTWAETSNLATCTVGGGFTGKSKFFTFYSYHRGNEPAAWYHAPRGLVMRLR